MQIRSSIGEIRLVLNFHIFIGYGLKYGFVLQSGDIHRIASVDVSLHTHSCLDIEVLIDKPIHFLIYQEFADHHYDMKYVIAPAVNQ